MLKFCTSFFDTKFWWKALFLVFVYIIAFIVLIFKTLLIGSCSLYAQQLKQAQEICQRYTFSVSRCNFFTSLILTTWEIPVEYSLITDLLFSLRIQWRLSTILKASSKTVWSNVFWYVKVCIFWRCIQYTIHWEKTKILKKVP